MVDFTKQANWARFDAVETLERAVAQQATFVRLLEDKLAWRRKRLERFEESLAAAKRIATKGAP